MAVPLHHPIDGGAIPLETSARFPDDTRASVTGPPPPRRERPRADFPDIIDADEAVPSLPTIWRRRRVARAVVGEEIGQMWRAMGVGV